MMPQENLELFRYAEPQQIAIQMLQQQMDSLLKHDSWIVTDQSQLTRRGRCGNPLMCRMTVS